MLSVLGDFLCKGVKNGPMLYLRVTVLYVRISTVLKRVFEYMVCLNTCVDRRHSCFFLPFSCNGYLRSFVVAMLATLHLLLLPGTYESFCRLGVARDTIDGLIVCT